jgi:hypothetical protein
LDKKSEEANYFQTNFSGLKENIEKKNDENKELRGKIFSLEEKNLNLEQELSSYRILHLGYDKENKLKDKKDDKDREKVKDKNNDKENRNDYDEKENQVTRNNLISKTRYEESYKNIVSPES